MWAYFIKESLVVVGEVGIQLNQQKSWWRSGNSGSNFIPLQDVADVIINEAIHRVSLMVLDWGLIYTLQKWVITFNIWTTQICDENCQNILWLVVQIFIS